MNTLETVTLVVSLAALSVGGLLWVRLREMHRRLHLLTQQMVSNVTQLTHVSRSALRSESIARLGERGSRLTPGAQHGEELFLWERCGFKDSGVFIEIGAYDGVSLSNSLFFEQIGWRGLLVEAHPDLAAQCRTSRPGAVVVHAALGTEDRGTAVFSMVRGARQGIDTLSFSSTSERHRRRITSRGGEIETVRVPSRRLDSLVAEHKLTDVDWVSIDVEGAELDVLKGAGLDAFRPKLILVEDNSGGLDTDVRSLLQQHAYSLILTIGCNDLYERRS